MFKKLGSVLTNLFKNKNVQDAAKTVTLLVAANTTPGKVLELALNLGVFNWLASLIGKSLEKVSGLNDDLSSKVVLLATKAVIETQKQIDGGKLTTSEQKRGYAQEVFKQLMLADPELNKESNLVAIAPVLIQFIYESGKLKLLANGENRKAIAQIMVDIGLEALKNKDIDPLELLFAKLDELQESKGK